MSEYLGWTERKPPRQFDTSRIDRNCLPETALTHSYENYVKNVFRPGANNAPVNNASSAGTASNFQAGLGGLGSSLGGGLGGLDPLGLDGGLQPDTKFAGRNISAAAILRMEQQFGSMALSDPGLVADDNAFRDYLDYGSSGIGSSTYCQYPVYNPKSSTEYFSVKDHLPEPMDLPGNYRGSYSSYRERPKPEPAWKKTDRQMLVDYKDFNSSPLSPYMYRDHNYVQRQDSRIVGSNFVQVTTRPRDRFLEKIDQTLAEVRAMPRY